LIWRHTSSSHRLLDNTTLTGNTEGISAGGPATVLVGRSVITANTNYGVVNSTSPNGFYSYLDNRINGNGIGGSGNVTGTALLTESVQ
jgi:hypothetical protein